MIVNNIKVNINGKDILNDISFSLNDNDKIGLVGINGSGKSTLLKSIYGDISLSSGSVNKMGESVSLLKQEIPYKYNDYTVSDYVKEETGLRELENKLLVLENGLNDNNIDEYNDVLEQFLFLDGYSFLENLKKILNGLAFNKSLDMKINTLSGGEKIKVLLACILLKNRNIILMDEPTNNLDLEAIEWLEKYLKNTNKKMIIVSHDEVFLNNIVNKIFELSDGKLQIYNMSYNTYLEEKEREYNSKYLEYKCATEEKNKLKMRLEQAKGWSAKGKKKTFNDNDKLANNYAKEKTNNSNLSKISKTLDDIEIPEFNEKESIDVFFNFDSDKGNKDIVISNLICGYDGFKTPSINMSINYGERVLIIGCNGSGKTTLIKTILGIIPKIDGNVYIGNSVKIGYISQDNFLDNDYTVLEYILKDIKDMDKSLLFTIFTKFNFKYEDKDRLYRLLSPGERTRVNLIKLILNKVNVLVLDEVTNHLDKEALDLIYELISSFKGTIISISHNRKFIDILNPDCVLDISSGVIKYK